MRHLFLFLATCSFLFLNIQCQYNSEPRDYSAYCPDNVLDYKGVPDSALDRSVFMFSDRGAWHGYALHEGKDYIGSFIGPFLMTQDNGTWLSPCLSKFELESEDVVWDSVKVHNNLSTISSLSQHFRIGDEPLFMHSRLDFVSDRTAVIEMSIHNQSDSVIHITPKWQGKHFLNGTTFKANSKGIDIDFEKNDNIGFLRASKATYSLVKDNELEQDFMDATIRELSDSTYSLVYPNIALAPNGGWKTYITHTFCFSEKEKKEEERLIEGVFEKYALSVMKNVDDWHDRGMTIIDALDSNFQTEAHERIAFKCVETLRNNWRSPAGFLKHDGLFPSYNYEWFNGFWSWDSWKHAVALARYDTELAQNQILAMYDFQDETGMIADCVYRDTIIENHNWRDTKPPLSAWAIWKVYEQSQDKAFLKGIFPKVEKYHAWWYDYRDFDQNGLCEYGSTDGTLIAAKWESGMDNAVRFDDTKILKNAKRGWSMNRESVDLNAYLFAEKEYLSKIAAALGETNKSEIYAKDAAVLKTQIQSLFYDDETGWFYDLDVETKQQLKVYGAEGWIPLFTQAATPAQAARVREIMLDTTKFATYIPFPTLAADHPKFKPDGGYWRGPVWLDQAYFAITGLKNYGYEEDALRFSNQLFDRLEGLKDSGAPIRENYHPLTGEGLESKHFSWSAAHLLLLLLHDD